MIDLDPDHWADRLNVTERTLGLRAGWQMLFSPWSLPRRAETWVASLNPIPSGPGETLRRLAEEDPSPLFSPPGLNRSPIFGQVAALAQLLGRAPEALAWGVTVPFRSATWTALPLRARRRGIELGCVFWAALLALHRPRRIIAIGATPGRVMADLLAAHPDYEIAAGWGKLTLSRYRAGATTLVVLPHLSRYRLFNGPACAAPLSRILEVG